MRHPVSIVLVVLLALSLPVSAVGTAGTAGSASVATESDDERTFQFQRPTVTIDGDHAQLEGTPNRLVLHGDGETATVTPTPDFGLAAASHDDSIRTDYRSFAFEREFEDLEGEENKTEAVVTELERIEQRIEDIREREHEIVEAHANGELSDHELLRTLSRNYHEARELQRALEELDRVTGDTVDTTEPVTDFTAELNVYTSPIRTEVDAGVRGVDDEDDSVPLISIESGQDGLVLSMIDEDGYVREATRYDNRDLDRTDQVRTMDNARDYAQDLYPWAYEARSRSSTTNHGLIQLYMYHPSSHAFGDLIVYIDGGTGSVYHERQELDLDRIPIETTDTMATENLSAALEQTPGTTPAKITVTEPETETPVDATVVVNGTVVGDTNDDGELWFAPPADEYELTVRTESESLNATVATDR